MPKQAPHWMFRKCEPDETLRDSVSGEFFNSTRLESVIREALQNSLDARAGKEPASVRIFYSGRRPPLTAMSMHLVTAPEMWTPTIQTMKAA